MRRHVAMTGALFALGACAVILASALPAGAHVTIDPPSVPPGTKNAVLNFVVPNERVDSNTVSLQVEIPTDRPIGLVRPLAGSGWHVRIRTTTLAKPVVTSSGTFTQVVSEIDWTGGSIPPGQFGSFSVLAQGLPTDGKPLVFPAIQTYANGVAVRWIDQTNAATPDPEFPAPTVTFTSAASGASASSASSDPASAPVASVNASAKSSSNGLAYLAIVIGCFAAGVGLLALWFGRLGRDETPADS